MSIKIVIIIAVIKYLLPTLKVRGVCLLLFTKYSLYSQTQIQKSSKLLIEKNSAQHLIIISTDFLCQRTLEPPGIAISEKLKI